MLPMHYFRYAIVRATPRQTSLTRARTLGSSCATFASSTAETFAHNMQTHPRDMASSPLEELRRRSERRGLCDANGARSVGAPWGMQLAHVSNASADGEGVAWPIVRTIGFQVVNEDGFTFLLKRNSATTSSLPVAMVYIEGKYQQGDVCEQWRAEGIAEEIPIENVLATAPRGSLAQIIATDALSVQSHGDSSESVLRESVQKADSTTRREMKDEVGFLDTTADIRAELDEGTLSTSVVQQSAVAYRVMPDRMEVLVGGPDFPMWERFEWTRKSDGTWEPPRRLQPY